MPPAGDAGGPVASVVDVGSNSVLLLTIALDAAGRARQCDATLATTRLGSGLRAGDPLDLAARARTRAAVVACCTRARAAGATHCWAFATGAARRARDGAAFAAELAAAAGCAVEVLSGRDEAALAYAAVIHAGDDGGGPLLAVDVGGATTELTFGRGARIEEMVSIPVGALGLEERIADRHAVSRHEAGARVLGRARSERATLIASGGTATALASLDLGLATYEPARVHGHVLVTDRLTAIAGRAADLPGVLDDGRARILPAGARLLAEIAAAAGAARIRVSEHGVRHGYLRRALAREGVDADLRALWS